MGYEKRWALPVLMLCAPILVAGGCGEESCPLCPTCPACTLVTSFDLDPVIDGYAMDGYTYGHRIYPKDGEPDMLYGDSKLIVKNNMSSSDDYNTECRSFMEFDIKPITGTVVAASLELALDAATGAPFPLTLLCYGYRADGKCTSGDFGKGGTFAVDTLTYNRQWVVTFDVSSAVLTRIAAGDTCAGFNIRIDPPTVIETEGPGIVFRSMEAGPPSRLTIVQSIVVER